VFSGHSDRPLIASTALQLSDPKPVRASFARAGYALTKGGANGEEKGKEEGSQEGQEKKVVPSTAFHRRRALRGGMVFP